MGNLQYKIGYDAFDDIRQGYAFVAEQADHVRIRTDKIASYAQGIKALPSGNVYDSAHHFTGNTDEEAASYVLGAESVNFGSAYKDDLVAEGWRLIDNSLYFTVTTALKRYYEKNGVMDANAMAAMTPVRCADIFGFDINQPTHCEVNALFCRSLNELGQHIKNRHNGCFMDFLNSGRGAAHNMFCALVRLPYYNDIHEYKEQVVPVFKRVQHSLAVIDIEFRRRGMPFFTDGNVMTMFADNAVPHVLRMGGILEYSDHLARKIENGVLLESGSPEEIEIRCCAGHAVELLACAKNMAACDVDFVLWHRSVEDKSCCNHPTHLTRSIYY